MIWKYSRKSNSICWSRAWQIITLYRCERRILHIWGFYVSWSSATCVPIYIEYFEPKCCLVAVPAIRTKYKAICQSLQQCSTSLRSSAHNIICKWSTQHTWITLNGNLTVCTWYMYVQHFTIAYFQWSACATRNSLLLFLRCVVMQRQQQSIMNKSI